jgi:hypothetical protein
MSLVNVHLKTFFLLLLFFPSILLLPIGEVEIFPYGILTIIFLRRISKHIGAEIVLLLALIYGALVGIGRSAPEQEFIRSLSAYMNVLIPMIYLLSHKDASASLLNRVPIVFWIMCVIGLIQYSAISPNYVEDIVRTVIPRFSSSMLSGEASRGASLLSSEPARAGYEFVVVAILYCWLRHNQGKQYFAEIVLSILLLLFVIRSGTAAFLLIVALMAFSPLYGTLAVAVSVVGTMFVAGDQLGRGLWLIQELLARPGRGEAFFFLLDESGFRLVSNLASYTSFMDNPFGYGIGHWQTSSLTALHSLGNVVLQTGSFLEGGVVAVRATSFFGQLVLDAGVVGLFASAYFIISRAMLALRERFLRSLFAVFLVITMLVGDAGNPVPWVGLSLMICASFQNRVGKSGTT